MFHQALSCRAFLGCNSHQRMHEENMDAEQPQGLSSSRLNYGHPASSNGAQGDSLHNGDLEVDGPQQPPGLDISPDEERLDYRHPTSSNGAQGDSLLNGDIEEDCHVHRNGQGMISRPGLWPYEPMDTSSDSVSSIHRRVFPPTQPRQVASNAAEYYKSEANRLTTFIDWQHQAVVRKEDLARNGFIYTGTSDKVRCHYCNGILRSWERGDVVETEHSRNFPQCLFVCGENVGNMPLNMLTNGHHPSNNVAARNAGSRTQVQRDHGHDISPLEDRCGSQTLSLSASHNTTVHDAVSDLQQGSYSSTPRNKGMAVEPTRLATFEAWPAQMKQKPKALAQAGLYYTGDGDKTKCFHCDGLLYNWDPEDDPFVEHARWFPKCQYIRLVKGETFVENVQKGGATHDILMEKPAVLAVLSMRQDGCDVDLVKKAVAAIRDREGANTDFTASELMAEVLKIEDSSTSRSGASVNGQLDPEDLQKLRLENESLRDRQMCKICMEQDVEIIFHPCNHFVCCASCSTAISVCPICRKTIQSLDKVFMA